MTQTQMFNNHGSRRPDGNGKPTQKASNAGRNARPIDSAEPRKPTEQIRQTQKSFEGDMNRTADVRPTEYAEPQEPEQVRLSGRIGRYFQVRQTRTGVSLTTFSMATGHSSPDSAGNSAKKTVWQRIVVWGEAAQAAARGLQKGARVCVEGKFKTREWFDRDNNLHVTKELVARSVRFLDLAGDSAGYQG